MESGKLIPCFALLVCTVFVLPFRLCLSQFMSFLTCTISVLSLITAEGSEQVSGCAGFDCLLRANHSTDEIRETNVPFILLA